MSEIILIRGARHVISDCINCGVVYTVPESVWNKQRQDGGYHHCSNGHSQGWSKQASESEKTRLERDRLKQQLAQKDDEIATQRVAREAAQRQAAAARGQVTRLRNRANAGLCPCCNRHFTNLERHMASKHAIEQPVVALVRA